MFTVQLNSDRWVNDVNRRARLLGLAVPDVVKSEARLWVGQAMRLTPPTNSTGIMAANGKKAKPGNIGEKRVRSDVIKSMTPADPDWNEAPAVFRKPSIRKLILSGDKEGFLNVIKSFGKLRDWSVAEFSPALHRNAQGSRGRVGRSRKTFIIGAAQLSLWWNYMRKTVSHVGRLRAGWAPSWLALGGKGLPIFVRRHVAGARGSVRHDLTPGTSHPFVEVRNFAVGVGSAHMHRICSNTFRARAEAMKRRTHLLMRGFAKGDVELIKRVRAEHGSIEAA
jgi:hypothetical protein